MRHFWWRGFALLLGFALYSCAGQKPILGSDCNREMGQARGVRDAKQGRDPDLSFLQSCQDEARSVAFTAYRESFESTKAKMEKEAKAVLPAPGLKPPSVLPGRDPAGDAWVCEVEANSKVFTGTGLSQEEALGLARSTCVSHFQASHCTEASCKKNL